MYFVPVMLRVMKRHLLDTRTREQANGLRVVNKCTFRCGIIVQ